MFNPETRDVLCNFAFLYTEPVMNLNFLRILFLVLLAQSAWSQGMTITGQLLDATSGGPVTGVVIKRLGNDDVLSTSDEKGMFSITGVLPKEVLSFSLESYEYQIFTVPASGQSDLNIGELRLFRTVVGEQLNSEERIPTISVSTGDAVNDDAQEISSVLTSSRDVFVRASSYTFGPLRFRIRGYDPDNTEVYLNGAMMNDPETGSVFWSNWGGLNEAIRYPQTEIGLGATEYGFGGVGGGTMLDTRAGSKRKQTSISYANSNRSFRHRLMGSYNTGWLPGGWAIMVSGSRRWSQEGYIEGTFYDSWSYFLSVDKKINNKHRLNLTTLGSPTRRGRSGGATQEMYDLAGSNYYNSFWGYQNGEKRNSREVRNFQPLTMLRHDWNLKTRTEIINTAFLQTGRYMTTNLDWYDGRNPAPDYYSKLPSYVQNAEVKEQLTQALRSDESLRQIDWDYMYAANDASIQTVQNANGTGQAVTGKRAQYVLAGFTTDMTRVGAQSLLHHNFGTRMKFSAAIRYQYYKGHNYRTLVDLLGADFYLDIDKFAETDLVQEEAKYNNLDNPNALVKEGDTFDYSYNSHTRTLSAWAQLEYTGRKIDWFVAAKGEQQQYWREGLFTNGQFPTRSKGLSEKVSFTTPAFKAGATYKLNGRNYLYVNASWRERAPFFRNVFANARYRNDLVPNLTPEKIQSIEGGYLLRAPRVKARATAYLTQFDNQINTRSFFLDDDVSEDLSGFINFLQSGIGRRFQGVELALEYQITPALTANALAALGQYYYTTRPSVTIVADNDGKTLNFPTVYLKNYRIPGTPQTAASFGLNYRGKKFWFASVNFNYIDDVWIDVYPGRRTAGVVDGVEPNSELWHKILDQQKAAGGYTVDISGGKSWKIKKYFIYLNIGINNVLNNTSLVTGGFEQFRFDQTNPDQFPPRLFYALGTNYFASVAFRF